MAKGRSDNVAGWDLAAVLAEIKNAGSMNLFLKDLLTPREYAEVKRRWQIVRLLKNGLTQREVSKKLNIAIATVTRGARVLNNSSGGFKKILKK